MIKFLFFFIFLLPLVTLRKVYFWATRFFLVLLILTLITLNLIEVDGVFFRARFYIDTLSFSLILLSV